GSSTPRFRRSGELLAHDRPRRLATRDLEEAGTVEHGFCTEPHGVVARLPLLVARIRFEQRHALLACPSHRAFEHRLGHAAVPLSGIDHEADDRPHRLVVNRLHYLRALESRVILAGSQRYPTDRAALLVPEQPRHDAALDQGFQRPLVRLRVGQAGRRLIPARATIEHAVAATCDRQPGTREKLHQIRPAIADQGLDLQPRHWARRVAHARTQCFQNSRDAMRAPSAIAAILAHTTSGSTAAWPTQVAKPQSLTAITFSRPTSLA